MGLVPAHPGRDLNPAFEGRPYDAGFGGKVCKGCKNPPSTEPRYTGLPTATFCSPCFLVICLDTHIDVVYNGGVEMEVTECLDASLPS